MKILSIQPNAEGVPTLWRAADHADPRPVALVSEREVDADVWELIQRGMANDA